MTLVFATDEEVAELTGEPAIDGLLLGFWSCDDWDDIVDDESRRQVLKAYSTAVVGDWYGCAWPKNRSQRVESWLRSDPELA